MDVRLWLDESHLRLLGRGLLVLGLALIAALSLWGPGKPARGALPRGFKMPMLAIELPQSGREVETIVEVSGGARRMKNGLLLDLGIILIYASVLAVLGALLYQGPAPAAARMAGAAAALLGAVAGLLDVAENVWIWRALDGARDEASLQALTRISLGKWGLVAVAFLLLAGLFLLQGRMAGVLAVLCLVTGVVGLLGLMRHPWLETAVSLMGITILAALAALACCPGSLK